MKRKVLTFRPFHAILLQWGTPCVAPISLCKRVTPTNRGLRMTIRKCDNCGNEFVQQRNDQRLCCEKCKYEWFLREKQQALAYWRAMQRAGSFFSSSIQPTADETHERNTIRRRA